MRNNNDSCKRCPHQTAPYPGAPWWRWTCAECGSSGTRMRALTLSCPYPYLILELPHEHHKNVENRTKSMFSELGPLLIHAAQKCTKQMHAAAVTVALRAGVPQELIPAIEDRPPMGLVGAVMVQQVLPMRSLLDQAYRWKFDGHVGYVISQRLKLPHRPMAGGQGIFHVDLTDEEERLMVTAGILT